jgi:colicin import membrane protein
MKILGYRSKKGWKMALATFVYGLSLLFFVSFIALIVDISNDEPSTEKVSVVEKEEVEAVKEEVKEEPKKEVKEVKEEPKKEVKEVKEEPKKEEVKKEEPKKEEPKLTLAQENAIRSAESYLDYTAFSKSGLIEQLEYEGFSTEDATFALDTIDSNVDWNEQAVKAAKSYLDYTSFSRSGLIEQLIYEGYTNEQATHAVDEIGL